MYSQHGIPWELNSCAISTRKFPLPHEQDICSQTLCQQDASLQVCKTTSIKSASTVDNGQEQNTSGSEDTDDNSAEDLNTTEIQCHPEQMLSKPQPGMPELKSVQERLKEVKATGPITTLMVCDLPCCLSIQEVVDTMNLRGFSNAFDLIYMPRPKGLRSEKTGLHHNLGYAFVNFKTPEKAMEFERTFSDFTFPGGASMKRCYTKPAQRQGYKANWKKHARQHKSGCCRVFYSTAQAYCCPVVAPTV